MAALVQEAELRRPGAQFLCRLAAAGHEVLAYERRCLCAYQEGKGHAAEPLHHAAACNRSRPGIHAGRVRRGPHRQRLHRGQSPGGEAGAGNKIYDGVEVDESGHVVAYYISNVYPLQVTSEVPKWTRVEAYGRKTGLPNILHIVDSERPDQYRGVPYLAQVIEPLLQLRRYTESELMAALVQSFFTAWIQTETNPAAVPFGEVGAGDIAGVPSSNPDDTNPEDNISNDPNEYEMGPGTVAHLAPGETIAFGNPNIPTAGFETFVKTLCRLVGSALELPYDVLVKEFNSSYSASRGALLEAWEAFKMRRAWLVEDFCQPVYELFIAEAVALGRIKAPGFSLTRWCGRPGAVRGGSGPSRDLLTPRRRPRPRCCLSTRPSRPTTRSRAK